MRTRAYLVVVLGVALLGAHAYGRQFGAEPAKLSTIKVAEDLFVIHNDYVPGNTTVLVTSEGVLLVDDKFDVDHASILAELKKITSQPVKYVVNTHHHGDHSGSNAKFQAMNAQVVASERARRHMAEAKQPGQPTMTFDRQAFIHLGGKEVQLHYFGRAHTNGDTIVYFPAHRAIAAGDMFTYGDATPQLIDYAGGGSAKEWTSTLDGALALDFETVIPGHGTVTTRQEMRKFRDSTLTLRNRVREMIVQKKSRADVEKMLRSEFHFADLHVARSLDGLLVELQ